MAHMTNRFQALASEPDVKIYAGRQEEENKKQVHVVKKKTMMDELSDFKTVVNRQRVNKEIQPEDEEEEKYASKKIT